jgi:hypothetical protein
MQIKERMLRFMMTFDHGTSNQQSIIETRPRSYSQDNIRGDVSEMLETKTQMSHIGGGYAFSQYVRRKDTFNDETESEHDSEDEENAESKKQTKAVLQKVDITYSLF